MWHEILFRVLSIINYIILIIIAIPLLIQVLYVLFAWIKKKTFPKSDKKAKIAYLIPAFNEESVIYNTVKECLDKQDYPKELFDVFVVANNCTDKTAELAEKAGAKVLILNDPDPTHRMALYPLKYGVDYILKTNNYDMIIHLDADNHLNSEYSSLMNDAYQTGIDFARPYEGSLNATQNFYTKACTLFYSFDSRYGSRVRERLNIAAHINGSGAMMSTRMLNKCGGYDAKTISDDAEFNFNRMLEGYKGHYIEDAVVYEDAPSSFKDTVNRNKRIFNGGVKLLKDKLVKMLGKFFVTGRISYIEMFMSYIFIFITVVVCTWLPAYYIYHFVYLALIGNGVITTTMMNVSYYASLMWNTLIVGGSILVALFLLFGVLQGFILVFSDYKKMGAKSPKEMISGAILFPAFLAVYVVTLCYGAFAKKGGWDKIKRNVKHERK